MIFESINECFLGLENLRAAVALNFTTNNENLAFNEETFNFEHDLPPMKRFKKGKELIKKKKNFNQTIFSTKTLERPLIFLKIMLASPTCSQNLKTNYSFHLTQFCKVTFLRYIYFFFNI